MSETGGRVFFARPRRAPERVVELLSVGVDIGSATAHLVFSRLVLVSRGSRSVVRARTALHESAVLPTPFVDDETIDAAVLGRFIAATYDAAGIDPEMVDTGALILTGLAARRANARAVGALFAAQAGRFVALSAGDALEAMLAAHGSGAVAISAEGCVAMNLDIGGGTSKIAVCAAGQVVAVTALSVGARLVCFDEAGAVCRIEPEVAAEARAAGVLLGAVPDAAALARLADSMAERLLQAARGEAARGLLLPPLRGPKLCAPAPDELTVSGGVAELIAGREHRPFGDLGHVLAAAVLARLRRWSREGGPVLNLGRGGIRATVLGAARETVQVSGTTIFVSPAEILPLLGLAVIAPALPLSEDVLDDAAIAHVIRAALAVRALPAEAPVALFYRWAGSATQARLAVFCRGVAAGLSMVLAAGHPLVLMGDGDVGGLVGVQCRAALGADQGVVSLDGVVLRAFDLCDIGAPVDASGAVPVVIKSLVFPEVPG